MVLLQTNLILNQIHCEVSSIDKFIIAIDINIIINIIAAGIKFLETKITCSNLTIKVLEERTCESVQSQK